MKNNVTRMLDAQKVAYVKYEFSPILISASAVAKELGLPPAQVYKTLVLQSEAGLVCLVMMPADKELELKALARAIGVKRVRMAAQKEAERLTGLEVGGISPLALLRLNLPTYIDQGVLTWDRVCVSGGARGLNLLIAVDDLLRLTKAQPVALG